MKSECHTDEFLSLLCRYMISNPNSMVDIKNASELKDLSILGYYDDEYYYVRPGSIEPVIRLFSYDRYVPDMRRILHELFVMNYIKVHWVLRKDVRYRPEKRIGKTKKRYITLYRRKLNEYMNDRFGVEVYKLE